MLILYAVELTLKNALNSNIISLSEIFHKNYCGYRKGFEILARANATGWTRPIKQMTFIWLAAYGQYLLDLPPAKENITP